MIELPKTPSNRLDGKTAFVAGGSKGIGLASACALAELGAHIVIAARNELHVKQVVSAMQNEGFSAEAMILDITNFDELEEAINGLEKIDIALNSAGTARHSKAIETSIKDFDFVHDLNVKAAYFLAQSAAKKMIAQGTAGSIIQISSQMGHVGGIDRAVYCASKFAVEGMTKAMAIEFGSYNIRVNTICPTFIQTPLTKPTFNDPKKLSWIQENMLLPQLGKTEDVMGAVQYLASDLSALVTGTALMIDAGWTAK